MLSVSITPVVYLIIREKTSSTSRSNTSVRNRIVISAGLPLIIAMTANAMAGDREKCIESGMNDYVTKPINSEQIHKKISQWLIISVIPPQFLTN
jgi:CheY-like chemotaxis protein